MIFPREESLEIRRASGAWIPRGHSGLQTRVPHIYFFHFFYVFMYRSLPVGVRPDVIQCDVREYFVFLAFYCYEPVMFHS